MSQSLVRQIGLWSGVAVVVGSTIGSGIFKSPSGIAGHLPGPLPMLAVWIIGGFIVLCGALTLAEVGSAYPYSGGIYVYIREAFGRLPAFLFGWAQLVVIRPSGVGALSLVFGQYALALTGITTDDPRYPLGSALLAIFAIVSCTYANIRGVKFGTAIQNLTTVAKVAAIVILIVLALALGSRGANFSPAVPAGSFTLSAFGLALVSVFWAYDGWADGSFVGGEIKDPKKTLPRMILIGTLGVILIYVLANVGYLSVFNVTQIADSKIIAADTMSKLVGNWGFNFIVGCVMISTFGTLNGSLLTSPRVFFALSEDQLFHPWFAKVHPRFETPFNSIALCGGLGICYVTIASFFTGSKAFGALSDAFVIAMVPFYALSVASVFVFRKRSKGATLETGDSLVDSLETKHTYQPETKTPFFPVTPIIFVAVNALVLVNSLLDSESRIPSAITIGLVLAGIPIFKYRFERVKVS